MERGKWNAFTLCIYNMDAYINPVSSSDRRGELSDYVMSASNSACSHQSFNCELAESFTLQGEKLLQQHEEKAFSLQPSSIPECTINSTAYNGPGRRHVSKKLPHLAPYVEGFTIQRSHKLFGAYGLTGLLQIHIYCSNLGVAATTAEDINIGFKMYLRWADERPVKYSSNARPGSFLVVENFCRSIVQVKITQTILYSQFRRRLLYWVDSVTHHILNSSAPVVTSGSKHRFSWDASTDGAS